MQKPQASSSFSALANVAFFRLWVAAVASGTAVAADLSIYDPKDPT
jgi:hypothetical protein